MHKGKTLSIMAGVTCMAAPYIAMITSTDAALAEIPISFAGIIVSLATYSLSSRIEETQAYAQEIEREFGVKNKEMQRKIMRMTLDEFAVFEHHLENYDGRCLEELMNPDPSEVQEYVKHKRLPEIPDYTINKMG